MDEFGAILKKKKLPITGHSYIVINKVGSLIKYFLLVVDEFETKIIILSIPRIELDCWGILIQ